MKEYQSLSHTRWDCKYHIVFIPKRRKKRILGWESKPERRQNLGTSADL
jgi:REP element-mobilizing transposase RayT